MHLLSWALIVDGITTIVTTSIIFRGFRNWSFFYDDTKKDSKTMLGKLFHCPMCFGFWVGAFFYLHGTIVLGLQGVFPFEIHRDQSVEPMKLIFGAFFNGAAASSLCWTTHLIRMKINETLGL